MPDEVPIIDTAFRSALRKLDASGRMVKVHSEVDPVLEVAAILKHYESSLAIFFERVTGYDMPVCGNLVSTPANVSTVLGLGVAGIRACMSRGLGGSIKPERVAGGPCHETVIEGPLDLEGVLPILRHAPGDGGKYITGGVVIAKDPETGVRNASIHRLQLVGRDALAIKLDYGRHLGILLERARKLGKALEVAIAIGTDLALMYSATAMAPHLSLERDEFEVAGAIKGAPLQIVRCKTVDLEVPAETEIVLEGHIERDSMVEQEGPFVDFVGLYDSVQPASLIKVRCITLRKNPVYYAILAGIQGNMFQKYWSEACLLEALKAAVPIVQDVELTSGGLCVFNLVLSVAKRAAQDEGLQRSAIISAMSTLPLVNLIIVVDEDIDIHNPADVEWALATRFDPSSGIVLLPGVKTIEYLPIAKNGMVTRMGIDATVPFAERKRYERVRFAPIDLNRYEVSAGPAPSPRHPAFQDA